jgi:hypothetical protein
METPTLVGPLERTNLNRWSTHEVEVEVEVKLWPTVSLRVELPSVTHDKIFLFCRTISGFSTRDALSDERMGL